MTDRSRAASITAGILFALAALVALSITLAFTVPESQNLTVILLRLPGRFLVESFHLAALYVPAVLSVGAALVLADRLVPMHLAMLLLSTVPFFTAATAVRIGANAAVDSSPITSALVSSLTRGGAITTTTLLSVLELAALILLWRRAAVPAESDRPAGRSSRATPRYSDASTMTASMRRIRALLEAPSRRHTAGFDSSRAPAPRSLVDLPTPDAGGSGLSWDDLPHMQTVRRDAVDGEVLGAAEPDPDPAPEQPLSVVYHDGRFREAPDDFDPRRWDDEWTEEGVEPSVYDEEDEYEDDDEPDGDLDLSEEPDDALGLEPDREAPVVPMPRSKRYDVPIDGLLQEYKDGQYWQIDEKTREAAETLRVTLDEFGIQAEVTGIRKGPVITMFEILPAPGVKLSKIVNLSDNIALRLAASSVRIVAPIPGKHAVGIEIPNKERAIVGFAELLQEEEFRAQRMQVPIALGKDIPGDAQIVDLTRMPHVL
ncbi:MAG: DNA translocase FtsK, partial [Spirochaetota bacterium]